MGRKVDTSQILDYQAYRLGFRDISASTNERSLISTIIPSTFHGNKLPTVVTFNNGKRIIGNDHLLYLTCVWNSFILDWMIRQKITTTLNFFFMHQLPIPRLAAKSPEFRPLVERGARLVGISAEFDDLLKEVFGSKASHQTHGVTCPQDRLTIRAEIDAIVARLYDLTEAEFQHILGSFPLVDEAVKAQTLNTYRDLMKLGKLPDRQI